MLITTLKIALRNLYREKIYAAINVAGLTLAISCTLVLGLYLQTELTYDQHFENHENIYRVGIEYSFNGASNSYAGAPPSLGILLAQEFDEIGDYVLMRPALTPVFVSYGEQNGYWSSVFNVSENFFHVFDHDIIFGTIDETLVDPQSVAISESFARRYFGNINPVGELLQNETGEPFVVDLVYADPPENSHLKYDLLLSYNRIQLPQDAAALIRMVPNVRMARDYNYLVTNEDFSPSDFQAMSDSFLERELENSLDNGDYIRTIVEPLSAIHYSSNLARDAPQGNRAYLYAFSWVSIFILLIACINYINLATARSIKRSKEVGLRKILGAGKGSLMTQFVAEALLFTFLSALFAVVLVEIATDTSFISELFGKAITFNLLDEPRLLLWVTLLALAVGILAGFYPAIYLSSSAPLAALLPSGKKSGASNTALRQSLVLIQFTISIAVIAITIMMANQMRFISERDLGFDKENLLTIRMIGADLVEKSELIKAELIQHPEILGVAVQQFLPGQNLNSNLREVESQDGSLERIPVTSYWIDAESFDVLGLELISGRNFSQSLLTDTSRAVIVNESMVNKQGWEEPIGKRIFGGHVVGVVKDFNFSSLHTEVEPLALLLLYFDLSGLSPPARRLVTNYMTVKLSGQDTNNSLAYLEERFSEYDPVHDVQFEFLDDRLNQFYESDNSLMRLLGAFASICIFIAALGLYGLASFTTEQRSKEIAIRKVLGASTGQIIGMLSKNVLGLTLIGAVFASVIAYWAINEWLSSFAYRADINMWAFVIAALAALTVALVTMALQSYRTAQSDPIDELRAD